MTDSSWSASRKGNRHAVAISLVRVALEKAFGRRYHLREEKPVALDRMSEPEPDLVVVPGRPRDYLDGHPAKPVLIVEVADSSLRLDRAHKATLYARAGVADYWVLNLVDEVLEVHREPVRNVGWTYTSVRLLKRSATVTPLAAPRSRIRVASMLP